MREQPRTADLGLAKLDVDRAARTGTPEVVLAGGKTAEETVACLAEDLRTGTLPRPANAGPEAIDALLAERRPDLITGDGWRAIDRHERERGRSELRPRVKLASRDELLATAGAGRRA